MTSQQLWFAPIQLGKVSLKNRIAVAPMTRISATEGGYVTKDIILYYQSFAGGASG